MENKSAFVSKIALIFVVYFGFAAVVVSYIKKNIEKSREEFVHSRLEVSLSMFLIFTVSCKMVFSVFGTTIRSLAEVLFLLDFYFTYMSLLGLFFILNKTHLYYSDTSQFVVINVFVLLINSLAFFLSSFKQNSNNSYDYVTGLVMMCITTILTIHVF